MRKILVVTETKSYLVHSICKQLEEMMYEVIMLRADLFHDIAVPLDAIMIYAEENLVNDLKALVYLRDKAVEEGLPIFVAGNRNDIESVEEIVPKHVVKKEFYHPFDVKEVVKTIDTFIEKYGKHNKKKILLVDDSGTALRNLKACLEPKYQVIPANSGAMAIKYITLNRPDLVLLDYNMPVVDGSQVLEMIRSEADFCDIPVIFLTSRGDKESIMNVLSLKPEGYLLKTMPLPKILKAVDDFFERQKKI